LENEIENVRKLISASADVNEKFNFGATGKITALFLAVMLGRTKICNVLIDSGADVHIIIQGMTLAMETGLDGRMRRRATQPKALTRPKERKNEFVNPRQRTTKNERSECRRGGPTAGCAN
jgi:hypothetical protein